MNTQPPVAAERSRFWRQLLIFGRWIVEREELSRDDDEPEVQRNGASPLVWLTSPDRLPNRIDSGPGRRFFFAWLASRDKLPSRSEALRTEPGFLGWVTAREDLPTASSEQIPAPRSLLRWLLAPEPHHRLENLYSTEEVPSHES